MRLSINFYMVVIAMMALGIGAHGQASCTPAFTPGVSPLPGVVGNSVSDCAFFDHGSGPVLYVTGNITAAGGMPVSRIARWDGVSWSDVGGGLNGNLRQRVRGLRRRARPGALRGRLFHGCWRCSRQSRRPLEWDDLVSGRPRAAGRGLHGGSRRRRWSTIALRGQRAPSTGCCIVGRAVRGPRSRPLTRGSGTLAIEDLGSGPNLYVGGFFSNIGGIAASKIASFDGTTWQPLEAVSLPASSTAWKRAGRSAASSSSAADSSQVQASRPDRALERRPMAARRHDLFQTGGTSRSSTMASARPSMRPARSPTPEFCSVDRLWLGGRRRWSQGAGPTGMATFDTPGPGGLLALAGDPSTRSIGGRCFPALRSIMSPRGTA